MVRAPRGRHAGERSAGGQGARIDARAQGETPSSDGAAVLSTPPTTPSHGGGGRKRGIGVRAAGVRNADLGRCPSDHVSPPAT